MTKAERYVRENLAAKLEEVRRSPIARVENGLTILGCWEPKVSEDMASIFPSFQVLPDATRQAFVGSPYLIVWHAAKLAAGAPAR